MLNVSVVLAVWLLVLVLQAAPAGGSGPVRFRGFSLGAAQRRLPLQPAAPPQPGGAAAVRRRPQVIGPEAGRGPGRVSRTGSDGSVWSALQLPGPEPGPAAAQPGRLLRFLRRHSGRHAGLLPQVRTGSARADPDQSRF